MAKVPHNACDTPAAWKDFASRLGSPVREAVGAPVPMDSGTYAFRPSHTPLPQASEETFPSLLRATIASAKGETHCTIRALECATKHGRSHDLGILLPVITGETPIDSLSANGRHAAMTTFVAATRAEHLLALAIHEDRAPISTPWRSTAGP